MLQGSILLLEYYCHLSPVAVPTTMPSLLPRLKPAPVRAISEVEEESLDLDMSTGSSEQSLDPDGQAETDQTDYQMVLRMLEDGEKVGDTELTSIHISYNAF